MGWEAPKFTELEKAINALDEVMALAIKQDLERLENLKKIYETLEQNVKGPDGLEEDGRSSTSI